MAHNLYYNEKSKAHSFFTVREKAWHGLGKVVEEYPTSAEIVPQLSVPNYFAIIRTNTEEMFRAKLATNLITG